MSFLDRFRKILGSSAIENKNKPKEISIGEMETRLKEEEKEISDSLGKTVREMYSELDTIFSKMGSDIKILEGKDVSKIRDDFRLKQITEIGKSDFLRQVKEFRDKLMIKKEGEAGILYINNEIKKFIKYSRSSYVKATQLIGDEIRVVKEDIDSIIRIEGDFLELSLKKIRRRGEIKKILKDIDELNKDYGKRADFEEKIAGAKNIIGLHNKSLNEINLDIAKIKGSDKFREKERISQDIIIKEEELKTKENSLKALLDLKLLERNLYYEPEKDKIKLMKDYIRNPSESVINDGDLKIYETIEDIRRRVRTGQIVLKDHEKVLKRLNFTKEDLSNLRQTMINFKEEIKSLNEKLLGTNLGLEKLESEKYYSESKITEEQNNLSSFEKKKDLIEGEIKDKEERIRLEFKKTIEEI